MASNIFMTFSLFKVQSLQSEKTPCDLYKAIESLMLSDNADYNVVMTIAQPVPLVLKFRPAKPELQRFEIANFSTRLYIKFAEDKNKTTMLLSVKPHPTFVILYLLMGILLLAMAIISRSAENLLPIAGAAILAFAWDNYCRWSTRRNVNTVLDLVK